MSTFIVSKSSIFPCNHIYPRSTRDQEGMHLQQVSILRSLFPFGWTAPLHTPPATFQIRLLNSELRVECNGKRYPLTDQERRTCIHCLQPAKKVMLLVKAQPVSYFRFSELSSEVLGMITSHCSLQTRRLLSQVNHDFLQASQDMQRWKSLHFSPILRSLDLSGVVQRNGRWVKSINLNHSPFRDVSVKLLATHCTAMTELHLDGRKELSQEDGEALSSLRGLQNLSLEEIEQLESFFAWAEHLSGLTSLNLSHSTMESPPCFTALTQLRSLFLSGAFTTHALQLQPLTGLTHLDLSMHPIADACLSTLSHLPLAYLNISFTSLSSPSFALLPFHHLRYLNLEQILLSEEDFTLLRQASQLEGLNLTRTGVSDKRLSSALPFLTRLRTLHLSECPNLSGSTLTALRSCTSLMHLAFSNNQRITSAHFSALNALSNLIQLALDGSVCYSADLQHLTHLTKLRELSLSRTLLDDQAVASFRCLTFLRRLSIGATEMTGKSLSTFSSFSSLEHLSLFSLRLTRQGLTSLTLCSSLTTLDLTSTLCPLDCLPQFTKLYCLSLASTSLNNRDLNWLLPLTHLVYLNLSDNPLSDEGIDKIRQQVASDFWPYFSRLNLFYCPLVTPHAVAQLKTASRWLVIQPDPT